MTTMIDTTLAISILAATLRIATPLLLSATGELVTQRAGIWNLGVEGTMLIGAFAAYLAVIPTDSPWTGALAGMAAGAVTGCLTAFLTTTLRLNQFITGLAMNLLAGGVTLYLFRALAGSGRAPSFRGFESIDIPGLSDLPGLGPIFFSQRPLTYVALLLVPLVGFVLYRTRQGLELRALGENPKALETKGLRIVPRFYAATIAGSALTGLGGAFLLLGIADRFIPDISAGRGWLVIVALVAGNWRVLGTCAAVMIFALLQAITIHTQVQGLPLPYQVFLALPYLASILLLTIVRVRSGQPARLGIPYERQ